MSEKMKKLSVYIIEVVYLFGALSVTFGLWILFIWKTGFYPEFEVEVRALIKSILVWFMVPLAGFAALVDLYAKMFKKRLRLLRRYGFIGKGLYKE